MLEAATAIGTQTARATRRSSTRASLPGGSLKARLCVAGRQALYAYCAEADVAHRRSASCWWRRPDAEVATLESYKTRRRAKRRSRPDLGQRRRGARAGAGRHLRRGLLSPSTGIIDSHGLMRRSCDARRAGADGSGGAGRGRAVDDAASRWRLAARARDGPCPTVVNAAGLFAQQVAAIPGGLPGRARSPAHFAKGHYYVLSDRHRSGGWSTRLRSPAAWVST